MAGWWMLLNDVHVRCDRPEHGRPDAPWEMARCLSTLYTPQAPCDDDEELGHAEFDTDEPWSGTHPDEGLSGLEASSPTTKRVA